MVIHGLVPWISNPKAPAPVAQDPRNKSVGDFVLLTDDYRPAVIHGLDPWIPGPNAPTSATYEKSLATTTGTLSMIGGLPRMIPTH